MMTKEFVRQNFMCHIARKAREFDEQFKLTDNLKDLRNRKEDSNALQYVLEDIYRKSLKSQEHSFQELLKIINEYFINESNNWINVEGNNGVTL